MLSGSSSSSGTLLPNLIITLHSAKAGPHLCALANYEHEDPEKIEARIETFIQSLVEHPLAVSSSTRPGFLTSGAAREALFYSLVLPSTFPLVARGLKAAMTTGDARILHTFVVYPPTRDPAGTKGATDLGRFGVTCLDSPPAEEAPTPEEIVQEMMKGLKTSKHFGLSTIVIDVGIATLC
jgi:hypothetical protein